MTQVPYISIDDRYSEKRGRNLSGRFFGTFVFTTSMISLLKLMKIKNNVNILAEEYFQLEKL